MPAQKPPVFRRPAWNEAAIWMGAEFFGLMRMHWQNRFRIRPSYAAEALVDVGFALANTHLWGAQQLLYGRQIENTPLDGDPVFIIGHWRTGTTLLHELLSLDPRLRYPTTFECMLPTHFYLSERFLKSWTGFTLPSKRPPDNMKTGWDLPQEDEFALCNMGVPSPYLHLAYPNEAQHWDRYFELDRLSPREMAQWRQALLIFLKRLTIRRPGRMLLKSPTHTFRLPTLHATFPDARFIHIVRNPFDVYPSTVNLWQSLQTIYGYQLPRFEGLEEYVLSTFVRLHERLAATRSQIPANRFHELRYEDLVREPVGQVRTIYDRLDLGDFGAIETGLERYAANNADYQRNHYDLSPPTIATISERWGKYVEKDGYAPLETK